MPRRRTTSCARRACRWASATSSARCGSRADLANCRSAPDQPCRASGNGSDSLFGIGGAVMNLALKPEHQAFADEVRDFARKNLSPATREKTFSGKHYDKDDHVVWQQALGRQGWLAYTWPKKHGGPGWDVTRRFLF